MPTYLVIGKGGREHAIAWKLASEPGATVYVAPGSPGISSTSNVTSVDLSMSDHRSLGEFAREHSVDVTVVGPEAPLVDGIADYFREHDLPIVGPGAAGAALEGSKAFAKEIMTSAGVPTAGFAVFDEADAAIAHVEKAPHPLVIKADGLAGGKGVVISQDVRESVSTLTEFMTDQRFGEASGRVLIEDFLTGPELSLMVLTDGQRVTPLATSRDHKRLLDGDQGPNTGGMGAITPSPDETTGLIGELVDLVIRPTLAELRRRGIDYRGFLYAGLMLTPHGPRVLEYNVRLGDPETQALMCAMSEPLGPELVALASGALDERVLAGGHACCVVLAAADYPRTPRTGDAIELPGDLDAQVFHAGTARSQDGWVTAGGRVISVVAVGETRAEARENAYKNADRVTWTGRQMRRDIGRY